MKKTAKLQIGTEFLQWNDNRDKVELHSFTYLTHEKPEEVGWGLCLCYSLNFKPNHMLRGKKINETTIQLGHHD